MAKKPVTPRSQIRSAVRQIWLRSRERAETIRRDGYECQCCHKKQSTAKGREQKVVVHHLDGCQWDMVIDYIQRHILQDPSKLITLCPECHDMAHRTGEI